MVTIIPESAEAIGFITSGLGAHSSRTIMLAELKMLMAACPDCHTFENYSGAILEGNVLLKHTDSTRKESLRRLRELYGLADHYLVFRALKDLWNQISEAQPILALSCALTRDPILRSSSQLIMKINYGSMVPPKSLSEIIDETFPNRFNGTTLANFGRHLASSWMQSGHLKGRTNKIRIQAQAHPSSCAFALFLGYLCGERGEGLFHTPWIQILDAPVYTLHNLAKAASQYGWLEYRQSGSITDISFRYLLRDKGQLPV